VTPYPGTPVRSALPCALLLLAGCFDFDSLDAAAKDGGADAREGSIADGPDDAPDDAPIDAPLVEPDGGLPVKRVFVTSQTWTGALGGLAGADAKCQAAAETESLGGEWRAFLSIGVDWAGDRVVADGAAFVRMDGATIASSKAELVGMGVTGIDIAIQLTETAELVGAGTKEVWTGTDVTGTETDYSHCSGWEGTSGGARVGLCDVTDLWWGNRILNAMHEQRPPLLLRAVKRSGGPGPALGSPVPGPIERSRFRASSAT
jgi:hypothetical protein